MEKRVESGLPPAASPAREPLRVLTKLWGAALFLLEELIPAVTLAVTVLAIMVQVFYRYVLDTPLEWPFELSIYAFVWTLYLGAARATRTREHIKLDIVYNAMPAKARKFLDVFFNAIVVVIFIAALGPIWEYLLFSYRIKTVALRLPWTTVFGVFPVFMILVIVHSIGHIVRDARTLLGRDGS
ncbi:MAG: TRAP transporter small permease [Firmicutes bacterium]|jgi:TRAP-type C4-dicarboxylate transport system permease small subunit|nr:TRAP transporter small permease [Bacillota bacterium]MDH7496139.1 TRAP transporter small permease [Bacillota bacterium]